MFIRSVCLVFLLLIRTEVCNAESRPTMPTHFDGPTVQKLVDSIEEPGNMMILRIGYFMRRGSQSLAVEDGFALLQKAAEKQEINSKRWFSLHSTLAFAAFRITGDHSEIGFSSYDAIFKNANRASELSSLYTLRQSINDYLFVVQGRFGDLKLQNDERTKQILSKAWTAYVSVLIQEARVKPKYVIPEPMWARTLKTIGSPEGFDAMVENTLDASDVPKAFSLYKAAATVLEHKKPERVVEILYQARPMLPQKDLNEVAWYFGKLVDILERQAIIDNVDKEKPIYKQKMAEAIAVQEDMVNTTGRGRTRLAELREKIGDEEAYTELVKNLSTIDSSESEIIAASEMLFQRFRNDSSPNNPDSKLSSLQIELLTSYLAAARPRDVTSELQARRTLAAVHLRLQHPEAALAILNTEHLIVPLTGLARYEWQNIQRLRKLIEGRGK